MIWVDREVKKIKERNLPVEWVDDMKTPSGRVHVGALRGVLVHDLVYKVLKEQGVKTVFTYVIEDHDPMDAIPSYLEYEKWEQYAGMQLYQIPSPVSGYKNYATYFAQEFIEVFNAINCHPKIIWMSDMYRSGKMNSVIREVLDATPRIREVYAKVLKVKKPDDWYPFHVVCEKCKKIGTTSIYNWDGSLVYYRCKPEMVAWAQGCGYEGKISPYNGNGKMPWRIEWPAKWKVIGVTIEGGGKDHMSAGGSWDMASTICREVLNYPVPYPLPYEWFTIGGKKMSSSKGIGSSAKEVLNILPPDVLRFFMVRTPVGTAIDFNPYGETIPRIFDDYDRCLTAYFDRKEKNIPEGKAGEVALDFARIAELSQVQPLPKQRIFLPRFRTVAQLLKARVSLGDFFERQKGAALTKEEQGLLKERTTYARIYLEKYEEKVQETMRVLEKKPKDLVLSGVQKDFIKKLTHALLNLKKEDRETIQGAIFKVVRDNQFEPKEVFGGLYQILIGKEFGPKAADLILEFGRKEVIKKLEAVHT